MNKPKVLQVAYHSLANGGIQAVLMGIVRNLKEEIDFDVLLFSDKSGYYDDEFLRYGNIYRINCDRKNNRISRILENISRPWRIFNETYKLLKTNNYDVIHCHNGFNSGIILFAAKIAKVPIRIVHSHNTASNERQSYIFKFYLFIMRFFIIRYSTDKVGCSQEANKYLFKNNYSTVINNAIDLEKFDIKKYRRNKCNNIRFIHVGRYCYQKNQLFLLEVLKNIEINLNNIELKMVGFGEDEEIIKERIKELNLEEKIKLYPSDSHIPQLLAESDYCIFPSNYEGLGIALIEAQAMGVKCFASSKIPKESNIGLCDYLDLNDGSEVWAKKIIERIKQNSENYNKISYELLSQYDIKEIVKKYNQIYRGLEYEKSNT